MKRILFFVLIGLLISSCAITTTTDFKEDFSGSAKTELNFEKYFDFMSSMIVKKSEDAKGEELEKSNQSMEEMRLKLAEEFSKKIDFYIPFWMYTTWAFAICIVSILE